MLKEFRETAHNAIHIVDVKLQMNKLKYLQQEKEETGWKMAHRVRETHLSAGAPD